MVLHYNLIYVILILEVTFFLLLSIPKPKKNKNFIIILISSPFKSQNFRVFIKCLLGLILVLFLDSINKLNNINDELNLQTYNNTNHQQNLYVDNKSKFQTKKFYAQRNMYLCGFTLFLSVSLTKTYSMIFEIVDCNNKIELIETKSKFELTKLEDSNEIKDLKEKLSNKKNELELLKSKYHYILNNNLEAKVFEIQK